MSVFSHLTFWGSFYIYKFYLFQVSLYNHKYFVYFSFFCLGVFNALNEAQMCIKVNYYDFWEHLWSEHWAYGWLPNSYEGFLMASNPSYYALSSNSWWHNYLTNWFLLCICLIKSGVQYVQHGMCVARHRMVAWLMIPKWQIFWKKIITIGHLENDFNRIKKQYTSSGSINLFLSVNYYWILLKNILLSYWKGFVVYIIYVCDMKEDTILNYMIYIAIYVFIYIYLCVCINYYWNVLLWSN